MIDASHVTTEFNTLFETLTSMSEKVDPIKLNQTLTATAQALQGLGDRFGQSIINGNEILGELNPQMPQIRRDNQLLADLGEVYANAAPDLFDGLENAVTTARTLNEQQGNIDQALMASIGFGNTGGDIFERGGPYLVRGAEDLLPTSALLDEYSPALFCTIRNYHDVEPKIAASLGGNGYSLRTHSQFLGLGAGNPYVYPDNLPRVNAKGGPEGRPGCWQPVTRDLWPAPYLVMDTGASIAPYNHFELGQADRHRVHLGPPGRGEHDQPMKITGTAIKLGAFALVLLLFTAIIIVVFGQMRFDRTTGYSAIFSNASGLRAGQFVRASGVEVGKVSKVELVDGGRRAKVDFDVERDLPLFQGTTASIRYLNLIGDRYMELKRGDSDQRLPAGGTIPLERTEPALDLDALVGGFRPLFRALDPDKVNNIAQSIITVFQGQGGTINDILDQTAQLTSALADRDQAIGEVVRNLNTVLDTTVKHQKQFDETVVDFEKLITGLKNRADPIASSVADISDAAGTVGDLLADNRPLLQSTVSNLEVIQQPLIDQKDQLNDILVRLPNGAEDHRPRGRRLRRLLQLLRLRHHAQAARPAARRTGAHGEGLVAAHG